MLRLVARARAASRATRGRMAESGESESFFDAGKLAEAYIPGYRIVTVVDLPRSSDPDVRRLKGLASAVGRDGDQPVEAT